jgi:hypothetical protein
LSYYDYKMDQTEIGKFVVSHWQDIALAVIIVVAIIGGVAFYHLAKHFELLRV